MSDITFSAKAYCKIILHAAKYPHCSVNGVLLSKSSSSKGKEIEFVDAVPLFHVAINLTPMAEIALMQIDEVMSQKEENLVISGYYTALENIRDCSFEKATHRIADKLPSNFPSPCLVVVDNTKLDSPVDNMALKVAQFADGSYKPADTNRICLQPNLKTALNSLLKQSCYNSIVDFDNHLDDISLDWENLELNDKIDDEIEVA